MPQTRYHNRDISGWTQQSSVNSQTYDSIRTYRRNVDPGIARLRIRTNIITGNYSVYLVEDVNSSTGDALSDDDTEIYNYNGSTDRRIINDSDLYAQFFTGGAPYISQGNALNLGTKQDTLALASTNATSPITQTRLQNLGDLTGYQSETMQLVEDYKSKLAIVKTKFEKYTLEYQSYMNQSETFKQDYLGCFPIGMDMKQPEKDRK